MNTEHEIELLKNEITRLGTVSPETGLPAVKFGVIVRDPRCEQIFEAIVGTLRAAKRKKVVKYDSEMLLQGVHDDVVVYLLVPPPA